MNDPCVNILSYNVGPFRRKYRQRSKFVNSKVCCEVTLARDTKDRHTLPMFTARREKPQVMFTGMSYMYALQVAILRLQVSTCIAYMSAMTLHACKHHA